MNTVADFFDTAVSIVIHSTVLCQSLGQWQAEKGEAAGGGGRGKTNSFQNRRADFCNETQFVTVIYWAPKASTYFPASDIWTLKNWQSLHLEPEILVLIWASIRVKIIWQSYNNQHL